MNVLQESPEERLNQMLLEAGLLSEIKSPASDQPAHISSQLVEVQGKPLSEHIIEDRR